MFVRLAEIKCKPNVLAYICTLCTKLVEVCKREKQLCLSVQLTFKGKSEKLFKITVCKL